MLLMRDFLPECGGDFAAPQRKNISSTFPQNFQRIGILAAEKCLFVVGSTHIYSASNNKQESANK